MQKSRLIAIAIGVAIAIAVGVAFAVSMQNNQMKAESTGNTEGHNIVVNLEEKLGASDKQSP